MGDFMRLSELQSKDVINIINAKNIGTIIDIRIDVVTGQLLSIIVEERTRLLNVFNNDEEIEIPYHQIVNIGQDYILVNYPYETNNTNNGL